MEYRFSFYLAPSRAGVEPYCAGSSTHQFESTELARKAAQKAASHPNMGALFVEIASVDGSVKERWIDKVNGWERA